MKSLRARLQLGVALGTTVVFLSSGILLYALVRRTLQTEFDGALADKARSLAALADQDEDGLDFELNEFPLPEFAASQGAEFCQVWNADGTVFSRSPSLNDRDLVRLAGTFDVPDFRTVQLPNGRPGRIVGMSFVPRQDFADNGTHTAMTITLVLGREIGGLQNTLMGVQRTLFSVGLVAVLAAATVLTWIVRRSLRPIDELVERISNVGENDLSARIDHGGISNELLPVAVRLNELLTRLEAAFQRERRFTGDVAHELRTPLAGIRSKLELALSRERPVDAYRKAMDDCLRINQQMQRMVENLLQLARADAGQLEVRNEPIDLRALLRDCWWTLEEKAVRRGLNVTWRLDGVSVIETDRDKLQLILHNVLDNAATYSNEGGQVSVSTEAVSGSIEITIGNSGSTVSNDQIQHVFDRFWRGDSSDPEVGVAHCGLGLPLCKAVVENMGGAISAHVGPLGEFTLTVRLPLTGSSTAPPGA